MVRGCCQDYAIRCAYKCDCVHCLFYQTTSYLFHVTGEEQDAGASADHGRTASERGQGERAGACTTGKEHSLWPFFSHNIVDMILSFILEIFFLNHNNKRDSGSVFFKLYK